MEEAETDLLAHYKVVNGRLVDNNGNLYAGNTPYIIISLDGRKMKNYNNFVPIKRT